MPATLSPPDLANAVTSFCTIGAGATTFAFGHWVSRHPARWRFAYFVTVGLFYAARARIAPAARPLLYAVTVLFLVGFGLATADGDVVIGRVVSMHALWHVVGSFALLFLWAFPELRLRVETEQKP